MHPTPRLYSELQAAFDHFNQDLFENKLPPCLITLQRQPKTMGYFSFARFIATDKTVTDEIALNPEYFAVAGLTEILQTIVHEMVHLWQFHFGSPGRRGYHNREWANQMEQVGLMPSSTAQPGGRRTGDCVSDYPIDGGAFLRSCRQLTTKEFQVSWYDRFPARQPISSAMAEMLSAEGSEAPVKPNKSNRHKYGCPICQSNAWGKPGLALLCGRLECNGAPFSIVE